MRSDKFVHPHRAKTKYPYEVLKRGLMSPLRAWEGSFSSVTAHDMGLPQRPQGLRGSPRAHKEILGPPTHQKSLMRPILLFSFAHVKSSLQALKIGYWCVAIYFSTGPDHAYLKEHFLIKRKGLNKALVRHSWGRNRTLLRPGYARFPYFIVQPAMT